MSDDSLIQALPDLIAFVRRDGVVLKHIGGRRMRFSCESPLQGQSLAQVWSEDIGALLLHSVHKALKDRSTLDTPFTFEGARYEARVSPQGRDRALCIFRQIQSTDSLERGSSAAALSATAPASEDRRDFVERLKQQVSIAALRETPLAVCIAHIDGLDAVGRLLDFALVEQLQSALLARLPLAAHGAAGAPACRWTAGRLGDGFVAAALENFGDRESLRALVTRLHASLSEPVVVGSATFSLTVSLGIAVLGEDAGKTRELLEHAYSAMLEARRKQREPICFYSDTLRLRSVLRLDLERELRVAIAEDQLALRYSGRYSMQNGELIAVQAYMRWPHALRGAVTAAEFLPIAETTGQARALSRWALGRLQRDLPMLRTLGGSSLRLSFGALRHHINAGSLISDVQAWLQTHEIAAVELELRIAERSLAGLRAPGTTLRSLRALGISIVIDEFGRGETSLARLARLPVHAIQLDRALVLASAQSAAAGRALRAIVAAAAALGLQCFAAGVDDESRRDSLRDLGCSEGLGDHFAALPIPVEESVQPRRWRST